MRRSSHHLMLAAAAGNLALCLERRDTLVAICQLLPDSLGTLALVREARIDKLLTRQSCVHHYLQMSIVACHCQ
jgi:hypothetical protein